MDKQKVWKMGKEHFKLLAQNSSGRAGENHKKLPIRTVSTPNDMPEYKTEIIVCRQYMV
jgi:hypothetical protein